MDQKSDAEPNWATEAREVHLMFEQVQPGECRLELDGGILGFFEDKDYAKALRQEYVLPALESGGRVIIDFARVRYATQSFIHALIGEALKRDGADVLDRIDFKNCSTQLKVLIELVIDYQLGGFGPEVQVKRPVVRRRKAIGAKKK